MAAAAWALAIAGCSSGEAAPDCVPATDTAGGQKVVIETTPLPKDDAAQRNNDWCRVCVMGERFASCQRVYGVTAEEPRDKIKERARVKACEDAGYPAAACPQKAIIGTICKGDPPPAGSQDPAKAIQTLFQQLNPPPGGAAAPGDAKPAGAQAPAAGEAPAPVLE